MLGAIKDKISYRETVRICTSRDIFKGCEKSTKRLYTKEYFLKVESCRQKEILKEERIAYKNIKPFLNEQAGIRYKFITGNESYYDLREGYVKIGVRSKKFKSIMPKSSLESILILEYMRGCGYRELYKGDLMNPLIKSYGYKKDVLSSEYVYESYYNTIINSQPESSTRKFTKNGFARIEILVGKAQFEELIHTQYKMEVLVWRYVLDELEGLKYSLTDRENNVYELYQDEVYKMGEYYMQKKIHELHLERKKGCLKIGDAYTFKCK